MSEMVTNSRGMRGSAQPLLAFCAALGLTLVGGALYGNYSHRWGPPADLVAAGAMVEQLPSRIGPWQSVEDLTMSKSALEMLECAGYVNRRYQHESTGQVVSVAVIVGPPGPTAVHTPEVCYNSRAYEQESERQLIEFTAADGTAHSFWSVDFNTRNVLADGLRVYYAWGLGDKWEASEAPRYQFAAKPGLYKIQLAATVPPGVANGSSDPGAEFLKEIVNCDWQHALHRADGSPVR